nr:hypothetical protein [Tanacetum cinerariifolium]
MGDENPIRTLGDYSRLSHEGYRNTIELPEGKNVGKNTPAFISIFPTRSSSNWLERFLAGSISTWENLTTRFLAQFFPPRRTAKLRGILKKIRLDESWDTIERLAQYENERWNDTFTSEEMNFSYENPNVEQLLRIMERKVDTLMKDAISLMGDSKGIFQLTTNEMCQAPTEPSRQDEFEHIVMNFIYDKKERIKQLKNYMHDITD